MEEEDLEIILAEIKAEQHISPFNDDNEFYDYINQGVYEINENCGCEVDYNSDLAARSLLKNYVLYAFYKKMAEFKQMYGGEFIELQAKYYNSDV